MSGPINFVCTAMAGVEDADRLCGEVLDAITAARPDLRFVPGASANPAARFEITRGNARGLGLEVAWIDAAGARTVGKPLAVTFFDRPSELELRRNFYATFLRENPIPF